VLKEAKIVGEIDLVSSSVAAAAELQAFEV